MCPDPDHSTVIVSPDWPGKPANNAPAARVAAAASLVKTLSALAVNTARPSHRLAGASAGYLALLPFPGPDNFQSGSLPIDIAKGSYGLAILLTFIGAILASIWPARSAARVDPVEAIGQ